MSDTSITAESGFDATSTTEQVLTGLDLTGRVALVTGASAGLGVETARALATAGAEVILAARNQDKLQVTADLIRAETPAAKLSFALLDLSDLDSVRACAEQLLSTHSVIDMLINNAGIMACPLGYTAQGHELQFGTNHLGHFLLTGLLLPLLKASTAARVINLSSGGHKYSPVLFDDLKFDNTEYSKWIAYGHAKTANALFSVGLDQRFSGAGIRSFAVHPGAIVTELGRHLDDQDIKDLMSQTAAAGSYTYKSVPQGAATSVWAATSPELEGKGGLYLEDCAIGLPVAADTPLTGYMPYALDPEQADRLWQLSEQLVGEGFS